MAIRDGESSVTSPYNGEGEAPVREKPTFEELFNAHYLQLVQRARFKYGVSPEKAEDLAQDTLLKAWRAYDAYKPKYSDSDLPWLYTILHHAALDDFRKENRQVKVTLEPDMVQYMDYADPHAGSGFRGVEDSYIFDEVNAALANKPPHWKESLALLALGYSYKEVSEITGRPVGTIQSAKSRCIRAAQQNPVLNEAYGE